MKTRRQVFLVLVLLIPVYSSADEAPAAALLTALAGTWKGQLYYVDYGSGQRSSIPLSVMAEVTPDGVTLIRRQTFTDPGRRVHAVSLTSFDTNTGDLIESYFREGSGELNRYRVSRIERTASGEWFLDYEETGRDDNRPAQIRHQLKLDGNTLNSTKSVRFIEDGEAAVFLLRNGTTLIRGNVGE